MHMRRRDFIKAFAGSAAWPLAARATTAENAANWGNALCKAGTRRAINPFLRGLEALGYVDGKTVTIECRDADGKAERLQQAANDLVDLKPDVIFSQGGDPAPFVKRATTTIPIVVVVSSDPVASGLVTSLGRPGGNITGVTYVHDMLAGKSVELLKDTVPSVSRVAILWNPDHADPEFRETERAARTLGVRLQSLEVRKDGDFDGAFQNAEHERAEALIVIGGRFMALNRRRIGDFAEKHRLIMVGVPSFLIEIGALLNYGPTRPSCSGGPRLMSTKFSRAPNPPTCPCNSRPLSS